MMTRAQFLQNKGAEIRRRREALGLSQERVADAIGAAQTSVGFWERGEGMIGALYADRLTAFFESLESPAGADTREGVHG